MDMDNLKAQQIIVEIYNVLQTIPVNGQQNMGAMCGVFGALQDLSQWANGLGGDADEISSDD